LRSNPASYAKRLVVTDVQVYGLGLRVRNPERQLWSIGAHRERQ